jgi:glycosyltransferase involved in cell wall biosynthesis
LLQRSRAAPRYLQTLLAHLSQDPGQVEVLVVDDGSTDATVKATDADGSYGPSELDRIIGALHMAPVAIGVRAAAISGPMMRRVASRVFNLTIRGMLGLPFDDT